MQITTFSKPKTGEGQQRSRPSIKQEPEFFNQTLDKYLFSSNKNVSSPKFFYRQYYQNTNFKLSGKNLSRTSTRMEGTRAVTSQSTKNTSRLNPETLTSFLQTEKPNNQRIKTKSALFKLCERNGVKPPYSEISEEPCFQKSSLEKMNLMKMKTVFYEKRKKETNKFFLPIAPIYSKRTKYSKNLGKTMNFEKDEEIKKAQRKFLHRKCFNDSDPYRMYSEKCLKDYFEQNIVMEKSHHCTNIAKHIQTRHVITDFQNNQDPFQKNENFEKNFKVNSIIHKDSREITQIELLNNQIKAKFLNQKNVATNSENKRIFLIVENLYLDEGIKNKLKYCYTQINYPNEIRTHKQINSEFEQIKLNLIDFFNINSKQIFIYLKNGTFIKNHYEVPLSEVCLIVSSTQRFRGIYFLTKDRRRKINMLSCQAQMEFPIREINRLSPISMKSVKIYEEIIKKDNRDLYEDTLKVITSGVDFMNSKNLEKIYLDLKKGKTRKHSEILGDVFEGILEEDSNTKRKTEYFDKKNLAKPLNRSKTYNEICEIYKYYKNGTLPSKNVFDNNEGNDDEDFQAPIKLNAKNVDLNDASNLHKIARHLDIILEKWQNLDSKKKIPITHVSIQNYSKTPENEQAPSNTSNELEYNVGETPDNQIEKVSIIEKNIKKFMTKKQYMKILKSKNLELFLQNIPNLIKQTHLTRKEIHTIYILYKVLQEVTSQRYDNYNLDDGLDYYTFRTGIFQVFVQSEELAIRIFNTIDFNYSGFLNWEEFINLMVIIRAKNLKEKIDLFIKIADEDGNGMLSKDEIFKLCKICLSKYIKEDGEDTFLDDLCEYFTKLIFSAVQIDITEEIPLNTIKSTIIQGTEESDLLAMFCGADI